MYSKLYFLSVCPSEFDDGSKKHNNGYPINTYSRSGDAGSFTRIFSFADFNYQITLYGLLRYALL